MSSVVDPEYWNATYADLPLVFDPNGVQFKELFERFLGSGGTCFEVGCYPGRYLVYLGRRFDYVVSGIDTTPYVLDRLPEYFMRHGLRIGNLYHGDFLMFEAEHVYDLVCSFGFVEHFRNFPEIIEKHVRLVKPGGTLVISCPNFRGLQYLFHRLLDPVNLQRHVLKAMSLERWREILEQNGMKVLYHSYYRTADFWVDTPRPACWVNRAARYVRRAMQLIDGRVNWPNPVLSPYLISFSQKPMQD